MPSDPMPPCPYCGATLIDAEAYLIHPEPKCYPTAQQHRALCDRLAAGDAAISQLAELRDWLRGKQYRTPDYRCIGCGATPGHCGPGCIVARVVA